MVKHLDNLPTNNSRFHRYGSSHDHDRIIQYKNIIVIKITRGWHSIEWKGCLKSAFLRWPYDIITQLHVLKNYHHQVNRYKNICYRVIILQCDYIFSTTVGEERLFLNENCLENASFWCDLISGLFTCTPTHAVFCLEGMRGIFTLLTLFYLIIRCALQAQLSISYYT